MRNDPNVIKPEEPETSNWRDVEFASIYRPIVIPAPHMATGAANFLQLAARKFDDVVFGAPPSLVNFHSDSSFLTKLARQETANQMADIRKNKNFKNFEPNRFLELYDFHDDLSCRLERQLGLSFGVYGFTKR